MIEEYLNLRKEILNEAIRINDMLCEMDLPDHLEVYRPDHCGLKADEVFYGSAIDQFNVNIVYYVPYEDYSEKWVVPSNYIGLSDKEIKLNFLCDCDTRYYRERGLQIQHLEREAKRYGYKLVEDKL